MTKLITITTVSLFALLTLAAFALSYTGLMVTASNNGKPGWMALVWPLLVDGGLLIFSLYILYKSLRGEASRWYWSLVALFTIETVAFNIAQSGHWLSTWIVKATPPVVLFLTLETIASMIKNGVRRGEYITSVDALTDQIASKTATLNALQRKIERVEADGQPAPASSLQKAQQARAANKEQALDALVDYLAGNPDASYSEAGQAIGRSKATVGNYISELADAGRLHRNGNGWTVDGKP